MTGKDGFSCTSPRAHNEHEGREKIAYWGVHGKFQCSLDFIGIDVRPPALPLANHLLKLGPSFTVEVHQRREEP
jgi:hypothetical protein